WDEDLPSSLDQGPSWGKVIAGTYRSDRGRITIKPWYRDSVRIHYHGGLKAKAIGPFDGHVFQAVLRPLDSHGRVIPGAALDSLRFDFAGEGNLAATIGSTHELWRKMAPRGTKVLYTVASPTSTRETRRTGH